MAQRTVTIASSVGLHARPAALFVQAAARTGLAVRIGRPGEDAVDATSILSVMTLGVAHGELVELSVDGDGAGDAPNADADAEAGAEAGAVLDGLVALLSRDLDAP